MPQLIETRPFTIHPDLYAWPSFRIFSERVAWLYAILLAAVSFLLAAGLQMAWPIAVLTGIGLVAVAFALTFSRYKSFLRRPENRQIYRNCVVSLTDEEIRQDYTDESFVAIKLFAIRRFRDIGDFYFVIATPQHGIVVPKAAFESPEESREFAERIRGAVAARR